ncbi:diguanylate cyclase [Vibrio gazogenes]|uniref:diguanylate cyclase n=1 Tax=Vibrio gazogenes DSM 21264 = NBRC 103151 TaxID=1123492 RepID=A0A1M4T214_VIBGA|nr:diguanylate cyclase [Vibrio gazogenes]USP16004.1 diguanylate cyclase [Vibrio gazogenes]SHE38532.1 diguanylate cyclase (GGDEF) domain-containing protein [Vibrio gazogenes DSM 21264] [Vibrio gazogenes DSM 21264 = NBRC 103151]SJN54693.1 putative diguanylate cyclase AdrA [Vibrio gazogenes]
MIVNGLEKWLGVGRADSEFRESSFIFISLTVLTSILTFFVYYNVFVIPSLLLAAIEAIGILFCLFSYYFLWQSRDPRVAAIILVSVMTSISLLFILGTGNDEFALAFCFLTPVIAIFILGYKLGSLFSLANFICVAYICITDMDNWSPVYFDSISFVHLTTIYFFLFSVSYFYDAGRRRTMVLLEESNRQLQVLSNTDGLTNISNRRFMEKLLLDAQVGQWVAIIDIDDFKQVNDEYGHEVGDKVLVSIANILQASVKGIGHVGRWGGEEFLTLFTDTTEDVIESHINQWQKSITDYDFGIGRSVTISCGIAPHLDRFNTSTFSHADEALYRAKTSGKNCFRFSVAHEFTENSI